MPTAPPSGSTRTPGGRASACWRGGVLLALALGVAPSAWAEDEPRLPAYQVVSESLLTGPTWSVRPMAQVHGYQARFVIDTDWGVIEAESVQVLAERIAEMPAVEIMQNAAVTEVLGEVALEQVSAPARALWNVVSNPVDTVVGLPEGVVRYFGERIRNVRDRAAKLGSRAEDHIFHSGSAYRDVQAPMSAWRTPLPDTPEDEEPWYDNDVTDESVRLVRGELRVNRLRREIAGRLGVNPDTDNPLIRPRLDRLAWMASIGRLGVDRAFTLLTAGAADVIGTTGDLNQHVLGMPEEDARAFNDARLARYCADPDQRYLFIQRGRFGLERQTQLIDRLLRLAPSAGCEALIDTAMMARSGIETRFVVDALGMIEHHFGDAARGGRFVPQGAILAYETPQREFVLPLPVDYLSWTPQMEAWFDARGIGDRSFRTVLVGGRISERAERELTRRGWSIVPRAPYPGAPPYASIVLGTAAVDEAAPLR